MANFNNPLNNIHIAAPCSADWNQMYGDNRKRFCGECKLNVYNLSGMTKSEAENLILSSEGRLCVRFYRRNDGTILTKDCPVGWKAIKRRVSGISAAIISMMIGIFGGIFAFNQSKTTSNNQVMGKMQVVKTDDTDICNRTVSEKSDGNQTMGNVAMPVTAGTPINLEEVRKQLKQNRK